jgi:hypothetical protein
MAEPGLAKPAAAVQAANYKPENGALMERCRALGTYATHSCRIDTNAISVDVLALMALITFVLDVMTPVKSRDKKMSSASG